MYTVNSTFLDYNTDMLLQKLKKNCSISSSLPNSPFIVFLRDVLKIVFELTITLCVIIYCNHKIQIWESGSGAEPR